VERRRDAHPVQQGWSHRAVLTPRTIGVGALLRGFLRPIPAGAFARSASRSHQGRPDRATVPSPAAETASGGERMSALVSKEIKFFVDRSRRGPAKQEASGADAGA
jgi:hypothetical protein